MADKVVTPRGTLSFPNVFKAKAAVEGAEPRFSLNLVFSKEQQKDPAYKALVAAVDACAKEFFNGKLPANWRNPLRPASEKEYAGYADNPGAVYISAWSKNKPGIIGPRLEEIDDESDVYAGQEARITLRPFGYNQAGNKGVGLGLLNVQITKRDAARLDGRMAARDEFDAVETEETEDAPF